MVAVTAKYHRRQRTPRRRWLRFERAGRYRTNRKIDARRHSDIEDRVKRVVVPLRRASPIRTVEHTGVSGRPARRGLNGVRAGDDRLLATRRIENDDLRNIAAQPTH